MRMPSIDHALCFAVRASSKSMEPERQCADQIAAFSVLHVVFLAPAWSQKWQLWSHESQYTLPISKHLAVTDAQCLNTCHFLHMTPCQSANTMR